MVRPGEWLTLRVPLAVWLHEGHTFAAGARLQLETVYDGGRVTLAGDDDRGKAVRFTMTAAMLAKVIAR